MNSFDYNKLFCITRERKSAVERQNAVEEYYSDRSRILYCSSFRRLQQKAQVFSLEPNSSVRTRLTHSLEVSDLGRTLAIRIGRRLVEEKYINEEQAHQLVAIVENACLIHDIGNPPFGHFGESAIKEWAKGKLNRIARLAGIDNSLELYKLLISDFLEFDGNPQGFRIITKLHCEQDKYSLNLTYASLFCSLKYSRAAGEPRGEHIMKKAGYFQSEMSTVKRIYDTIGMEINHRYPFTYIMEAADDIAYCLSDIGDGIEKKIISSSYFAEKFQELWEKENRHTACPVEIPEKGKDNFNLEISVKWSRKIIESAVENYMRFHPSIYDGVANQLIDKENMGLVLDTIKQVSRKIIYRSPEAENIELSGYAVITGLLKHFSRLLVLPYERFSYFVDENKDPQKRSLDYEWRLFNKIGKRYVKAYTYAVDDYKDDENYLLYEWWLRVHMVIDYISGMTDGFALSTYQMLEGIEIVSH